MITEYVFIPDADDAFKAGEVVGSKGEELQVKPIDSRAVVAISKSLTFPVDSKEELDNPPADLIRLSVVHRPFILYTLRKRFFEDKIYTNVGQILVAVNPFKWIEGLYGETVMKQYKSGEIDSGNFPHVYVSARDSFEGLAEGKNQSLVIRCDYFFCASDQK